MRRGPPLQVTVLPLVDAPPDVTQQSQHYPGDDAL